MPRIARLLIPVVLVACAPAAAPAPPPPVRPAPVPATATAAPIVEPTYAPTTTDAVAGLDVHAWPPPQKTDQPWVAFERPWLHRIEGAPPTFYTTTVQPDPKRKNKVQVVALDARQLELEMAVGKEGPWPPDEKTAGKWPRAGAGKLPRDPAVAKRVVAAFNGAFRLDQNADGMMIRRRVFAPVVKNVASLLMHDDGRLGFGTWAVGMSVPPDVRSLRQNLDPLLEDGTINPHGRKNWGGILGLKKGTVGQRAKRSGICRTAGGHLLYLWGDGLEPNDLAVAMKQVGCEYGMHLDMNPIHVGFVFMSWDDAQYKKGKSESLSPALGISDTKYIHAPNPKEFFYATLRVPYDPSFQPDGQLQPPPAWMPAILARSEGDVRVTLFDHRRVRFAVTSESGLDGDATHRVLAGLALDGPTVKADGDGHLDLGATLIEGGVTREVTENLELAVGLTQNGDLVVAEGSHGKALVDALIHAGCVRAVAGRGKLERAGRDAIPSGGHGTRLYVVAERPADVTYRLDRPPH